MSNVASFEVNILECLWVAGSLQEVQYVRAKSLQSCLTLCDPRDYSPSGFSVHADSLGKNSGVSCHALLEGIFLT